MKGIDDFHREISAHRYRYFRPGIETMPWGRSMTVIDPFMNTLRFNEDLPEGEEPAETENGAERPAFKPLSRFHLARSRSACRSASHPYRRPRRSSPDR
ncbi:glyoxalase superfamily protein [Paracoccus cavernae]|uniref:Glyoxalase superfamily protein n=1 Tax=Paracoccus cavernae TaxID=1571207 RepID=A0ABT8DBV2_9RHOB|nr:glyoxalase superfamily protein [Paracoccus cavernae]